MSGSRVVADRPELVVCGDRAAGVECRDDDVLVALRRGEQVAARVTSDAGVTGWVSGDSPDLVVGRRTDLLRPGCGAGLVEPGEEAVETTRRRAGDRRADCAGRHPGDVYGSAPGRNRHPLVLARGPELVDPRRRSSGRSDP